MTVKSITQTEWREASARKMKADAEAAEKERLRIEAAAEEMIAPFFSVLADGENPWGNMCDADVSLSTREWAVATRAVAMLRPEWDARVSDRTDELSMDGATLYVNVKRPSE